MTLPTFYMKVKSHQTDLSYAGFTNPHLYLALTSEFFNDSKKKYHWLRIIKRQKLTIQALATELSIDLYQLHQEESYRKLYQIFQFASFLRSSQAISPRILVTYSGPLDLKVSQPIIYERLVYRLTNLHHLFPFATLTIVNNPCLQNSKFIQGGYQLELNQFIQDLAQNINPSLSYELALDYDVYAQTAHVHHQLKLEYPSFSEFIGHWNPSLVLIQQTEGLQELPKVPIILNFEESDPYECLTYKQSLKSLRSL